MSTNDIKSLFYNIGLEDKHFKVYISSLKLGESSASSLAKESDLPRSSTYDILEELAEHGLVSEITTANKKMYTPSNPRFLMTVLEKKKLNVIDSMKKLEENINKLDILYAQNSNNLPKVRFYEGEDGIKTTLYDSLSASKIYYICNASTEEKDPKYLLNYIKEIILRQIQTREIIHNTPEGREYYKKYNSDKNQILLIPEKSKYVNHVDKIIYDKKIAIIDHEKETGILIEQENIFFSEKEQFESLWNLYSTN